MTRAAASIRDTASPLTFFALLFLLSLPFWVVGAIFPNPAWFPMGLPVSALQFVLPLFVACVLTYRSGRWRGIAALLRRTVSPRGSRRSTWWLVVVLLVPAMMAATYGFVLLAGTTPHGSHSPLGAIPALFVLYVVTAACEEAGWMGYTVEPLKQRWGALAAGLVLGGVWALWHLVAFVQADRSTLWIVGQCLSTVAIRVLMVWLFDTMGGIVLTAVVVHAFVNVTQSVFPGYTQHATPAVAFGLVSASAAVIVSWFWADGRPRHRSARHPRTVAAGAAEEPVTCDTS